MALVCYEGHASVKPNFRVGGHQRVVREPFVSQRIGDDKHVALHDGMGAERDIPGRFRCCQAHLRLEPLAVGVDEAYERDWSSTNVRGQEGEIVECPFGIGIEDLILAKGVEPRGLVFRQWRFHFCPGCGSVLFSHPCGL